MPCNSAITDFDDAKLVADKFKVRFMKIDLKDTFNSLEKEINSNLDVKITKEAEINIKPRLRMTCLYAIAQNLGYLVIGTGNLSETVVGYTTKWGDNSSDFNPIGNFTANQVITIGRYLGVPEKILNKAPNDGLGGQTDEEKMGVKYSEIEEMINTGETNPEAKEKILKMFENSRHKRNKIPVYNYERKNYFKDRKE